MKAMMNMGKELKAIGEMIAGSVPFDAQTILQHATTLHDNCHHVEAMFPPGSTDHLSHAKPLIWEKPEAFHEAMQRLHDNSENLLTVAASGDKEQLLASFASLRESCNSCHDEYRTPEEP